MVGKSYEDMCELMEGEVCKVLGLAGNEKFYISLNLPGRPDFRMMKSGDV